MQHCDRHAVAWNEDRAITRAHGLLDPDAGPEDVPRLLKQAPDPEEKASMLTPYLARRAHTLTPTRA